MRRKYAILVFVAGVLLSACHSTIEDSVQETSESAASSESAAKAGDEYIYGFKADGTSYEWMALTDPMEESVSISNISSGLLMSYDKDGGKKYVYYPYTGEEPVEITGPDGSEFIVVDDGTDYVYIAVTPEGDSASEEWEYRLVDKSELLSGQMDW